MAMGGLSVVDAYGDQCSQFAQAMCLAAKQLPPAPGAGLGAPAGVLAGSGLSDVM